MSAENLLTTAEVAERVGVSKPSVSAWALRGRLAATKVPGRGPNGYTYGFAEADVDAFIAERAAGGASGNGTAPAPPGEEPTALELAEQLEATVRRLVRALRREQDQTARLAEDVAKLLERRRPR